LAEPLARRAVTTDHLQAVQRRRTFPTKATQRVQVLVQERILDRVLGSEKPMSAPWAVRLFNRIPWLRRIPARIVGMGFRPEHVRIAAKSAATS
jgi:hypothetical protein